jgi:hypothetical protein
MNRVPFQKERINCIKQALQFLNSGGNIIISTPLSSTINFNAKKKNWEKFSDGYISNNKKQSFQRGFTQNELKEILQGAGLENITKLSSSSPLVMATYEKKENKNLKVTPKNKVTFINDLKSLEKVCKKLEKVEAIGLDVETTIYATPRKLCTIQVSSKNENWIIDPLIIEDFSIFFKILEDPKIVKIIHNARFEQSVFRPYGTYINNVYDTMLVSRHLFGIDRKRARHSLGALCKKELGYEIDKTNQTSTWTIRPLCEGQVNYAALDSEVLVELYYKLKNRFKAEAIFT